MVFGIDADNAIHIDRTRRQLKIKSARTVINILRLCDFGYYFLRRNLNDVRSQLQIIGFAVKIKSRPFAIRIYVSLNIRIFFPIFRFQTLSVFQKLHYDAAIRRGRGKSDGFFTVHGVVRFETVFYSTPIDAAALEIL